MLFRLDANDKTLYIHIFVYYQFVNINSHTVLAHFLAPISLRQTTYSGFHPGIQHMYEWWLCFQRLHLTETKEDDPASATK